MRIVLVTGGASGIGYGTGAAFAAAGDRVILTDAREEVGRVRAEEIGARFLPLDVADPDSVADALAALEADGTELDVLVHSAGLVSGGGPLLDLPVEDFDTCVAVNLRGTFLVLRAVGDHLRRHGRGGAIVTVSSAGARQPTPGLGHYEATKAGVEALTRAAAIEFAPHGIRVNAVAPGPVLTPMTAGLVADP
ncbi:MAG: SDR family oxidoreductase, partial [Actinobacteria bacterium]|nr:SDR family oxidoreductase [Actinomycetota bacterium]